MPRIDVSLAKPSMRFADTLDFLRDRNWVQNPALPTRNHLPVVLTADYLRNKNITQAELSVLRASALTSMSRDLQVSNPVEAMDRLEHGLIKINEIGPLFDMPSGALEKTQNFAIRTHELTLLVQASPVSGLTWFIGEGKLKEDYPQLGVAFSDPNDELIPATVNPRSLESQQSIGFYIESNALGDLTDPQFVSTYELGTCMHKIMNGINLSPETVFFSNYFFRRERTTL